MEKLKTLGCSAEISRDSSNQIDFFLDEIIVEWIRGCESYRAQSARFVKPRDVRLDDTSIFLFRSFLESTQQAELWRRYEKEVVRPSTLLTLAIIRAMRLLWV